MKSRTYKLLELGQTGTGIYLGSHAVTKPCPVCEGVRPDVPEWFDGGSCHECEGNGTITIDWIPYWQLMSTGTIREIRITPTETKYDIGDTPWGGGTYRPRWVVDIFATTEEAKAECKRRNNQREE